MASATSGARATHTSTRWTATGTTIQAPTPSMSSCREDSRPPGTALPPIDALTPYPIVPPNNLMEPWKYTRTGRPASRVGSVCAIQTLSGRAAHLDAVRQRSVVLMRQMGRRGRIRDQANTRGEDVQRE